MKILLTHRYFWPDSPPYASMLRTIGDGLVDAGHDVHVFASKPSYRKTSSIDKKREKIGGLSVRRCWVFQENRKNPVIRAVNVLLYCASLYLHVLRLRPDVVMASTFPPVIAGWTACFAARQARARFIYHVMDIHPEVSQYSGGRLGRGLAARVLRWLDNQTLRNADTVVTLSGDMEETLAKREVGPLPIVIINNFSLDASGSYVEPPMELRKPPNIRRVIFAGNLGRFQNLLLLAEGVATCFVAHPDLELFFLGDGVMLPELKARWGDHPQVQFGPFLPFAQARNLISEADVGLASLAPDIYRVAYPSKILTYTSMGLRVLVLVEPDSQIARDLASTGQGVAPVDPKPAEIGQALESLLNMPVNRKISPEQELSSKIESWAKLIEGCNSD
jgi:glycosyltransferase involved in cell wall biosynthesis